MSNATMAATTNLGSYGKTQLQQDTGDAVQSTCGGFVAQGFDPNYSLFATCRAMVHTGNALTGTGAAADSLGLSEDQLASSLQQIAAEEFLTTGSVSNELATEKATPVLSRLSTLRSGTKGFSLSNLTPLGNPDMVVGAPQVQRGGSAGVDGPGASETAFAHEAAKVGVRENVAPRCGSFFSRAEIDHVLVPVLAKPAQAVVELEVLGSRYRRCLGRWITDRCDECRNAVRFR